ncbi:protein of unknown function (DUF4559) [Branchiostoma belcheri]|nr:protein of unknown function (DUF4559) [Branchiostoma belcheri]
MSLKYRRNSEGYKNWLKVGLALLATRDGLTSITLQAAKELHAELKAKLGDSVENCTCNPKKKQECKVFMPRGQNTDNTGPKKSDTSALLNFIVHCKFCNKYISAKASQKVTEVRNRAMHSADLTFSQQEFQDHMAAVLNLMRDPQIKSDPAAQKAADEISKIQTDDFHIGADKACHDAEVRVFTDLMGDFRKSLEAQEKELGDHATRLDALEQGKTTEEKVSSKTVNSILDMVNGNADLQSVLQVQASELSTMLQQYESRLVKVEGDMADTKLQEDLTKVKQKLLEAPPGSPKFTPGASISYKNTLQEYLDKEKLPKAKYKRLEGEGSNAGQPPFTFRVVLQYKNALFRPDGGFASKKVATQKACELALQRLGQSHLTNDPTHFRAELQEYLRKQGQDQPEINYTQDEMGFYAEVKLTGTAEFPPGDTSTTRKEAEQNAAEKALLALGVPLPAVSVRPRQASPVHGTKASNKDDTKAASESRAVVTKDGTDYKAILKEHVKKQKLSDPFYKTTPDGVIYQSTVTFQTAGAYQTTEPAKGKKEAEQNAANAVVRMLGAPFRDTNYKGALQEFITSTFDLSNVPTYHTYKCQDGYLSVVRSVAITEACTFKVTTPKDPQNAPDLQPTLSSGGALNGVKLAEQKVAKFALDILGVPFEASKQTGAIPKVQGSKIDSLVAPTTKEDSNAHKDTSAVNPDPGIKKTLSTPAAAKSATYAEAKHTGADSSSSPKNVGRVATSSKNSTAYMNILQKHVQGQKFPSPRYKDFEEGGTTLSSVSFKTKGAYQTKEPAKGKKEAEQNAAKAVIEMLPHVTAKGTNYKGTLQEYVTKENPSDIPTYYTYKLQGGYISVVRCHVITEPCSFNLVTPDSTTDELQGQATSLSQGSVHEEAKQKVAKFALDVLGILTQPIQTAMADTAPEAKGSAKEEKDHASVRTKMESPKLLESTSTVASGTEASTRKAPTASNPSVTNKHGPRLQNEDKPATVMESADINYKAILQQHVQKQRLPLPKYLDIPTDDKTFLSTVSFKTAGAYQTVNAATSKKDSEQNAAKSVIDLLKIPLGDTINYKGSLQQHAVKLDSTDIPKYQTYDCDGGFKTVVTCGAITEATSFEVGSEACNSKKEAQQRAARRAVELLDIPLQ